METEEPEETYVAEVISELPMDAETWKETGVKTGHDGTGEFSEMGFGLSDCLVSDDGSVKSQSYHDLSMSLQSRLLKCCRKHGIAVAANGTDLVRSADASSTRGLGLTRNPQECITRCTTSRNFPVRRSQ